MKYSVEYHLIILKNFNEHKTAPEVSVFKQPVPIKTLKIEAFGLLKYVCILKQGINISKTPISHKILIFIYSFIKELIIFIKKRFIQPRCYTLE